MLLIESGLVLLAVLIAFLKPTLGSRFFERAERAFSLLANHRRLAVVVSGAAALALRLALLPVLPVPEPIVHDEFGYLLAADTFARGHVTNPTHPMWVHFETFSVLQTPTYQCFAQPAQGLLLGISQKITGDPFWGVWLSGGLMCAALCWMLQGWLPAPWALVGASLAILRFGTFSYWANSYWGGCLGAIGGALVLGALPRIRSSLRVRHALVMGSGLSLLANNRPYEGFVLGVTVAFSLLAWAVGKKRPHIDRLLGRFVVPICLLMAVTSGAMCYYFWRVTGNPFRMPYQVERAAYSVAPLFLWQPPRPEPTYNHSVLRQMYVGEELLGYRTARSPAGFLLKGLWFWCFYVGPVLSLPFLMMIFILPYGFGWRDLREGTRFLSIAFFVMLMGLFVEVFFAPHYAAPMVGIVIALVLAAMRQLRSWFWHGKPAGLFLTRAIVGIWLIMFLVRCVPGQFHIPIVESYAPAWYERGPETFGRVAVMKRLEDLPGQHLVFVRYHSEHEPFKEWVYNKADINSAKVAWARDMDPSHNEEISRYFNLRKVWLVEADEDPPKLSPYQVPTLPIAATK